MQWACRRQPGLASSVSINSKKHLGYLLLISCSNGDFIVNVWFCASDCHCLKKWFPSVCVFLNRWCNIKITERKNTVSLFLYLTGFWCGWGNERSFQESVIFLFQRNCIIFLLITLHLEWQFKAWWSIHFLLLILIQHKLFLAENSTI